MYADKYKIKNHGHNKFSLKTLASNGVYHTIRGVFASKQEIVDLIELCKRRKLGSALVNCASKEEICRLTQLPNELKEFNENKDEISDGEKELQLKVLEGKY